MDKILFGKTKDNKDVFCYKLYDNQNHISILSYGATIQSLVVKNSNDELIDVVLGFDNLSQYEQLENRTFMGAVCGRYANRIANASFYVNGEKYDLLKNNNGNCLHSGIYGFDKEIFELESFTDNSITLFALSPDGSGGFPGDIALKVKYTFKDNILQIEYFATTTKPCPINITNHSYFNLLGKGDILSHKLKLNSNYYMNVDDNGLANGLISKTTDSPFDFSSPKELSSAITHVQKSQPSIAGIDHHFYANVEAYDYRYFATLSAPDDSLFMDIYTNQSGAQIYTGNFIPDVTSKFGKISKFSGVCIETQLVPNSMSFPYLPSPILKDNETYYHKTSFKFYNSLN